MTDVSTQNVVKGNDDLNREVLKQADHFLLSGK